jgi:hypothetical protein
MMLELQVGIWLALQEELLDEVAIVDRKICRSMSNKLRLAQSSGIANMNRKDRNAAK